MELILGLSPMTQFDAMAPAMWDVFTDRPDLTPYSARPAEVALDEVNPPRSALSGTALYWAEKSMEQNLAAVDAIDEDTMNRILWYAMKGEHLPYPEEFTGPAGHRAHQR
jgi:hypothetical protein